MYAALFFTMQDTIQVASLHLPDVHRTIGATNNQKVV